MQDARWSDRWGNRWGATTADIARRIYGTATAAADVMIGIAAADDCTIRWYLHPIRKSLFAKQIYRSLDPFHLIAVSVSLPQLKNNGRSKLDDL